LPALLHTGSSWRSIIKPPHVTFEEAEEASKKQGHTGSSIHQLLHNTANTHRLKASCPVVCLPEVVELDGFAALKLHVFKQELLSGALHLLFCFFGVQLFKLTTMSCGFLEHPLP
jgi:hypothetical protein